MYNIMITYSGFILFFLSSIFAFLQYRGKKKLEIDKIKLQQEYESKKIEKQLRFNTYMQYISKIDALNHKLQNNLKSEELLKASSEMNLKVLTDPNNSPLAIKEYMDKVNRFLAEWGTEQYRTTEELSGVKLVCSDSIFNMLEEYSLVAKDYVDNTLAFMGKFQFQYPINKDAPEIISFKNKYDRMVQLRSELVNAMRKEIRENEFH